MKNSQKGFIVPLLIAIVAVLAIGGGAYFYMQTKSPKTNESIKQLLPQSVPISDAVKQQIQACDSLEYIERNQILCLENLAVKNNNPAICDELGPNGNNKIAASNVPFFKANCLGMVNKDIGYCKVAYKDKTFYNLCADGVAVVNLDKQLCKQIVNGQCAEDIAIKTKDPITCSFFNDRISKNFCLNKVAVVSGNVSYCASIETTKNDPYGKNFCIVDVARFKNNRTICSQIIPMTNTGITDEDAFVTNNFIEQCKTETTNDAPSLEWVKDYI